jgi:hypothetical protein
MQKGLLNSPTDGNGTTNGYTMQNPNTGVITTPVRQSLSGPDSTTINYNQGMPPNMPKKDCGCGNKTPMNQSPAPVQKSPMPQSPSFPTAQQMNQFKNTVAAKYPQQNQ